MYQRVKHSTVTNIQTHLDNQTQKFAGHPKSKSLQSQVHAWNFSFNKMKMQQTNKNREKLTDFPALK